MGETAQRIRVTAWVEGRVQGVGFRWWVRSRALEMGLVGAATNLPDGRVQVVAEGPRGDCEALLSALRGGQTPGHVDRVQENWNDVTGAFTGFSER